MADVASLFLGAITFFDSAIRATKFWMQLSSEWPNVCSYFVTAVTRLNGFKMMLENWRIIWHAQADQQIGTLLVQKYEKLWGAHGLRAITNYLRQVDVTIARVRAKLERINGSSSISSLGLEQDDLRWTTVLARCPPVALADQNLKDRVKAIISDFRNTWFSSTNPPGDQSHLEGTRSPRTSSVAPRGRPQDNFSGVARGNISSVQSTQIFGDSLLSTVDPSTISRATKLKWCLFVKADVYEDIDYLHFMVIELGKLSKACKQAQALAISADSDTSQAITAEHQIPLAQIRSDFEIFHETVYQPLELNVRAYIRLETSAGRSNPRVSAVSFADATLSTKFPLLVPRGERLIYVSLIAEVIHPEKLPRETTLVHFDKSIEQIVKQAQDLELERGTVPATPCFPIIPTRQDPQQNKIVLVHIDQNQSAIRENLLSFGEYLQTESHIGANDAYIRRLQIARTLIPSLLQLRSPFLPTLAFNMSNIMFQGDFNATHLDFCNVQLYTDSTIQHWSSFESYWKATSKGETQFDIWKLRRICFTFGIMLLELGSGENAKTIENRIEAKIQQVHESDYGNRVVRKLVLESEIDAIKFGPRYQQLVKRCLDGSLLSIYVNHSAAIFGSASASNPNLEAHIDGKLHELFVDELDIIFERNSTSL